MSLFDILEQSARRYVARGAVYRGRDQVLSFGALRDRALALGGALAARARPGDRVVIAAKNCPEYVELLFACWAAGLVVVPINAKLHEREMAQIVEDAAPIWVFASAAIAQALAPQLASSPQPPEVVVISSAAYRDMALGAPVPARDVAPDDLAWLFFTSGTTGRSKGAMLSHRNLLAMTEAHLADFHDAQADNSLLHAAPMSHGSGLYILPYIARGARQVIPASGSYDPAEFLDLCEVHPKACAFLAPTMVQRLRLEAERAGRKPGHIDLIIYGGGPMYLDELKRALARFGPVFAQLYGQGEAPMTITGLRREDHATCDEAVLGSVGWPRSGVEVAIVDPDGRPSPPGEVGEITCRGEVVMQGYWRDPAATASALRDGWLWTGDLGVLDANGRLTLRDRSKDVIISGGSNIYPREVEEALLSHPGVAEAAVVGQADPEWGEVVVAFVVRADNDGCSAANLDAHCLDRIARFKRPKTYVFVDQLPKNNYGKVLKRELAQLLPTGSPASP